MNGIWFSSRILILLAIPICSCSGAQPTSNPPPAPPLSAPHSTVIPTPAPTPTAQSATPNPTISSQDVLTELRLGLATLTAHVNDIEKFNDKILTNATAQIESATTLGQSTSSLIGFILAGFAVLTTILLFFLGANIWRTDNKFRALSSQIAEAHSELERSTRRMTTLIEQKNYRGKGANC